LAAGVLSSAASIQANHLNEQAFNAFSRNALVIAIALSGCGTD